ncbi:MAG TPA: hypothetical protein VJM08_01950 [Anaerolineales bacterium]|nr:hypothetical protein [Anaerolineales bacterium]
MTRRTIHLLSLIFAVFAIIFVVPPILDRLNTAPLILSSQPDFVATPEKANAPNPNPSPSDAITLLVVTEKENSLAPSLQARPVDPTTLANLPDYAAIDFGHHYTYVVSPDRKILAVITWTSDWSMAGKLHLIDLDTWTDTPVDLRIDNYVSDLTFSADAKKLYWTMPTVRDPVHGILRDYQLYQYDLASRHLSAVAQFPSSFLPWSQRSSSENVAIFGVPTGTDGLTEDVPRVIIVDSAKDHIMSDIRLDSVKAGQFHEQMINATPSTGEEAWQSVNYSPGLAWDLDRNVLYIVHADEDKITVVDLVTGSLMKQAQIRPRQPLLEWMSDLLVPAAAAKGGPWLGARVLLSGDGEHLYVFSEKTVMGLSKPVDLRVIATAGMREIAHINELLTDFSLTPDGKSLLVVKAEVDKSYGFDALVSRDVYVLDAESLQERGHIQIDQADQIWFDGFSPDGRYAYLRGASAQWVEGNGWTNWRTVWHSLNLNSYHLISGGELESLYGALLHIAP